MKNENAHMQALHRKLDVVLVEIMPYDCSETDYNFLRGFCPLPRCGFQTPLLPPLFFRSTAPVTYLYFVLSET